MFMLINLLLISCNTPYRIQNTLWYKELVDCSLKTDLYNLNDSKLARKKGKKLGKAFRNINKKLKISQFEPFRVLFQDPLKDMVFVQRGLNEIHRATQERFFDTCRIPHLEFKDRIKISFDCLDCLKAKNAIRLKIFSILDNAIREYKTKRRNRFFVFRFKKYYKKIKTYFF